MSKTTTHPTCPYVVDLKTLEVCGDEGVELYRSAVMVCEQHRFHFEYEARKIAERHYSWIEREHTDENLLRLVRDREAAAEAEREVYYMECGGFVKIGVAGSAVARLRKIQRTGGILAPRGLDLSTASLLKTEQGGQAREAEMHKRFADLRDVGEWFRRDPILMEHIAAIR